MLSFRNYVLIVLNTKVLDQKKLIKLWNQAQFRVTVDGGTNQWHEIVSKFPEEIISHRPDLITGDLDSVFPEVLEFYKEKSTKIIRTPDQNYTDFTKALQQVEKLDCIPLYDNILAFAEHSGRLDQIFGIFETLFHAKQISERPVFVTSSTSIEWLLHPGYHRIVIDDHNIETIKKLHCGLIPLGKPCPGTVDYFASFLCISSQK